MQFKKQHTQSLVVIQSKAGCEQQAEHYLQNVLLTYNVDPLFRRWLIVNASAGKFYLIDTYHDKEKIKLNRCIKVAKSLIENAHEFFLKPPSVELAKFSL